MPFFVNHKFSDMQFSCNFHAFFGCLFWLSYKVPLTLAMILGVKGKVLEIDSQKILRPDPGLYSQYFLSYAIFCFCAKPAVENWVSENLWFTKNVITRKVL